MDIKELFNLAQNMQSKIKKEMENAEIEAQSGGGMVKIKMNGKKELLSLVIDPEVLKDNDIEMLQDLIIAAVNQGARKVDQLLADQLSSLTGGLNLPGM